MAHKLLLVHGDEWVVRSVEEALRDTEFVLRSVSDGVAALSSLAQERPDVVVSDIVLPRLDGITLMRALQGRADTREVPVLLLSARSDPRAAMRGLAAGARYYVTVPFQADDLWFKLDRLVSSSIQQGLMASGRDRPPGSQI